MANTVHAQVILDSDLISIEEIQPLINQFDSFSHLTAQDILELDLPAKVRVEALLRYEFLEDVRLRELACDFIEHTLHIFEEHASGERGPRNCIEVARLCFGGSEDLEKLQKTIQETIPSVWQFAGTPFVGTFQAGLAATFLVHENAAEMAQLVARHTQRAAHRRKWESRKSDLQLMIGREKEAAWQLKRIVSVLHDIPTC